MQPSDILDLMRASYGLTSDYQVMKKFGFSQACISGWRTDRYFPNDTLLIEISEALDIHLGVLLLHSAIWRQKNATAKEALEKILAALAYCEQSELLD
ncbi:hypothetical protein RJP56_18940 [Shewanella baltica]|uniref:hypothetical protein n=1 Tax=Shewanella baltica TaxID=62322 RepID=UPI00217D8C6A|nr:hypothetical protein [Shewanella baltica]MCS6176737.1 hypothetical protein [Shewanella baltica]MDR9768141.1 hypothetical protein [Shewanella baltica]